MALISFIIDDNKTYIRLEIKIFILFKTRMGYENGQMGWIWEKQVRIRVQIWV